MVPKFKWKIWLLLALQAAGSKPCASVGDQGQGVSFRVLPGCCRHPGSAWALTPLEADVLTWLTGWKCREVQRSVTGWQNMDLTGHKRYVYENLMIQSRLLLPFLLIFFLISFTNDYIIPLHGIDVRVGKNTYLQEQLFPLGTTEARYIVCKIWEMSFKCNPCRFSISIEQVYTVINFWEKNLQNAKWRRNLLHVNLPFQVPHLLACLVQSDFFLE